MSDTRFYHKMCLKSQKQSQTLCLIEGRTLWTTHVIYNSYSCYFCYEVAVMISLLFFLIYCYQMKFPDKLRLNLSWFFLYTSYTCHNRQSKYQDLTWTTLYENDGNIFQPKTLWAIFHKKIVSKLWTTMVQYWYKATGK